MEEFQRDFIDRALEFINPKAAYSRLAWKWGCRSYDSGSRTGNNSGWAAVNAPAEQMNQGQRDLIRARSRDLERNADIAESIIGAFERNVIGVGLSLQAKVLVGDTEDEDDNLNKKIEEYWGRWCEQENCDIQGELSFEEMQEMIVRRMKVDGGILCVLSNNPYKNGEFSLMLQLREVDEIDNTKFSYASQGQNRIINGIELNEYNKPVAYWLKEISPDGVIFGDSKRISADRVLYLRKKKRPTQIREVSDMASTIDRVRDINEFTEAISVKERILACLSVFIKKQTPGNGVGRGNSTNKDTSTGLPIQRLSPGIIKELQPGEDVATVNPSGQASNAKEYITTQQRLIGSGQGLTYEAVSRDMSQVNYSSARQGRLEDNLTYSNMQRYIIRHFCRIVYREFVTELVLTGKLVIKDFFSNKEKYLRHEWNTPGQPWIDPLKEVKANEAALSTGQTTLAAICAGTGQDWREVAKQRAIEIEFLKSLGMDEKKQEGTTNEKQKQTK